jgi:hypothetical protein
VNARTTSFTGFPLSLAGAKPGSLGRNDRRLLADPNFARSEFADGFL